MRKYRFSRNLGLKIMAFVFSVVLWLIVVNVDDPVTRDTFTDIPVTFVNDDIITQDGNVYQVVGEQSVNATIAAKRSILQNLDTDDIVATADIREMDTDTGLVPVEVSIPDLTLGRDYQSAQASPTNLQIRVEKTGKKVLTLIADTQGNQRDGYIIGDMTVSPERITITGAESQVEQISRAVALIQISGISKDTDIEAELKLYDEYGNELSQNQLSNNLGEDGITVHVEVLEEKSVPVNFSVSGTPAEGYQYVDCVSEPESVQICGRGDVLDDVNSIDVPASVLNIDGVSENMEQSVDITPYLPEGVSLTEEASGTVTVTVRIEQEGMRTIDLLVSSVRINNLSDGLQVSYQPDAEISLQFRGEQELLDVLDISNAVSVDMTDYTEPGTYDVPVTVNVPDGITVVGETTVQLTLEEKTDETVPQDLESQSGEEQEQPEGGQEEEDGQ